MTRPAQYAKGIAKRAEIIDTALQLIGSGGYDTMTIPRLAKAVGLSQPGLIHYFGTKDQLFVEILRERDERTARFAAGSFTPSRIARDNASVPGLIELYTRVMVESSGPSHAGHEFTRERYEMARREIANAIRQEQTEGKIDPTVDPAKAAALIFAAWDGLQIQWMHDRSIDIPAHLDYLWQALTGYSD
ncbi:TetR/AcrR family transcriptional regulator [Leifsonia sp. NPDC058230]|uniref:TetR/AcrR family transcriptional regulator n=1 Tax=Leifsonia sp. NPDC058230 TaxID=3346391 RepID=UPI0036DA1CC9